MSLPNGSASASERTLACPSWLAFPRVDRSSDHADRGTQVHAYIRAVLTGTAPADALALVDLDHRPMCVLTDWRKLGADLVQPLEMETSYAVDVRARTARYLGENLGRGYESAAAARGAPLGPWSFPGSLDIAGRRRGHPRTVVVIDAKTGFLDVTPADQNGQGAFFAAAKFLICDDVDDVEFRIAKIKPNGDVWDRDRYAFTRLDVDSWLDDMEAAIERSLESKRVYLSGGAPDVTEGPWCRYCPAADACPAKTRLLRALLPELLTVESRVGAMTVDQVGAAWEIAHDRAAPLLARVLDLLKDRIHREGIVPIPGGSQVAKSVQYPMEKFTQKRALALLTELGATQAQIAQCYSTSEIRKVQTVNASGAKRGRS